MSTTSTTGGSTNSAVSIVNSMVSKMIKLVYSLLNRITEYRQLDETGARVLANLHNLSLRIELLGKLVMDTEANYLSPNDDDDNNSLLLTTGITRSSIRSIRSNHHDDIVTTIPFSYENYRILGPLHYYPSTSILLYRKTVNEFTKQQHTNLSTVYTGLETVYSTSINLIHDIEHIYTTTSLPSMEIMYHHQRILQSSDTSSSSPPLSLSPSPSCTIPELLYFVHILQQWMTNNIRQKLWIMKQINQCVIPESMNGQSELRNIGLIVKKLEKYSQIWTFKVNNLDSLQSFWAPSSQDTMTNASSTIQQQGSIWGTLNTLLWKITGGNKCMEEVFLVPPTNNN